MYIASARVTSRKIDVFCHYVPLLNITRHLFCSHTLSVRYGLRELRRSPLSFLRDDEMPEQKADAQFGDIFVNEIKDNQWSECWLHVHVPPIDAACRNECERRETTSL